VASNPDMTTTETGALKDVSRWTVLREIRAGNLEAHKAGGRWMVTHDDACRWAGAFEKHAWQRNQAFR
jgi:hypothetical protein